MPPRDIDSINDMVQASLLIREFVTGLTKQSFQYDALREAAVIREIEIIGEAARRISPEFRAAHPEIPWSQIIGMRNLLIHAYDHVDPSAVWDVTQQDIPELIRLLTPILPEGLV